MLTYLCYGVPFGIEAEDRQLAQAAIQCLPPACDETSSDAIRFRCRLFRDGTDYCACVQPGESWRGPALPDLLTKVRDALEFAIACNADDYIFVHAAACSLAGRGIVLPGRSFAGKTTLLMALMREGAVFFSDEFAVFDIQGRLHPFARPLSLRTTDGRYSKRVTPVDLGYPLATCAASVDLVADLHFKDKWSVHPLSPGECSLALFNNTIAARRIPVPALQTLMAVCGRARGLQGTRGGAEEAARKLAGLLA